MPPYSVPRRPFTARNEDSIPINWRRGMVRVWILVSAAWIMGWILYLILYSLQGGFKPSDTLAIPVLLIGPPVALLLFGVAAGWAFRGFRVEEAKKEEE
jgi:hypothetical protein